MSTIALQSMISSSRVSVSVAGLHKPLQASTIEFRDLVSRITQDTVAGNAAWFRHHFCTSYMLGPPHLILIE